MAHIERNHNRIFYEVTGSGPAIVLGHSFLCSGKMWANQIEPLSRRHKVINIDLRGHGRSGIIQGPFELYDLVDDVLAVLDHIGIETAVWAGLSIGGMVAMRAALVAGERVSGLILMDTDAGAETSLRKLKYGAMTAVAKLFGTGPLVPRVTRMFFGPHTRSSRPDLVDEWRSQFASVPLPTIVQTIGAIKARDSVTEKLRKIDLPALVIVGAEDTLLPLSCSTEIADALPNASLVVIEKAGHLPVVEQPEAVNSAMLSFLDGL